MTGIKSSSRVIRHDNFALSTGGATKTPTKPVLALVIDNMDSAINALVSFDAGVTFKTVRPGQNLAIEVDRLVSYVIKSASGTPNVECLYFSEE